MRLPSSASMQFGPSASLAGPSVPGLAPYPIIPPPPMSTGTIPTPTPTSTVEEFAYVAGIFSSANLGNWGHSRSRVSVRGDGKGLEAAREMTRREREEQDKEVSADGGGKNKESEKERRTSRESRPSSLERRLTPLMYLFPEVQVRRSVDGVTVYDDAEEDHAEDEARYRKRQNERDSASIKQLSYPILRPEA
ncbi:hypothetical protein CVT25_011522 [Psilocybe cyanescens]|uniref:Uncharacterized protein n=1 Tax=Psilocybe cyanescens TaxID=93625 RepID=A0A409XUS8_PSICY|nr:hypothetical protein CVT25_011522 [Psilocybe cyanescens]